MYLSTCCRFVKGCRYYVKRCLGFSQAIRRSRGGNDDFVMKFINGRKKYEAFIIVILQITEIRKYTGDYLVQEEGNR